MTEPGWYHDPLDPSQLRLWDGTTWTDQTTASGPPSGGSPTRRGRRSVMAIAAVVAVVAVAGAIIVTNNRPEPQQVVLAAAASTGTNAFFESVATPLSPTAPNIPEFTTANSPGTIIGLSGDTPGLFASPVGSAACDIDQLLSLLATDPERANAFASALQIDPGNLDRYVSGLTAVFTRIDLRVTSYGYLGQAAQPFQAVLEAGTAVMVNDRGVPSVRCVSSSPLGAATAVSAEPAYTEPAWGSFDPSGLITITAAPSPISTIDVLDPTSGNLRAELVAAGGLELRPDGLAVVNIGDPTDEVIATLTALLGNPTYIEEELYNGGLFLQVAWRSLTTVFLLPQGLPGQQSPNLGFQGYMFGPWTISEQGDPIWWVDNRGDDGVWRPLGWERSLATAEGIGITSDAAPANAAFPNTTVTRDYIPSDPPAGKNSICAVSIENTGLTPLDGIPINDQRISAQADFNGLFFAPLQNGRVWGIGAGTHCFT